ncbi:MAG: indolepyruvate oxidoreductase subunit beta [Candidatus Cloacimonetes bacterium]|nr:indolepyruvate oxidoreductase subunit beta [Candidatus Cloacimonadota bacterium]MBS3767745.1 indolepyruvate oxidoreductase subunit beta [Candidatus Cloacimonadota bacterium]
MKKDIILAGVGGQGILTIATILGDAVIKEDLNLKQAEVHGMSQRGGAVQSHVRISDEKIHSDLIHHSTADIILSLEPMESLRYLPYLKEDGWLITNTQSFVNIPNYPQEAELLEEISKIKNSLAFDAVKIAKELGSIKATNIVMLGTTSKFIGLPYKTLKESIKSVFATKGDKIVKLNLNALEAGKKQMK